jgi:IS5 family transposase
MGSAQGKQIYQQRCATAETVNADLKAWRGLDRLRVRGLIKVNVVALLTALTYNLLRCIRMQWL